MDASVDCVAYWREERTMAYRSLGDSLRLTMQEDMKAPFVILATSPQSVIIQIGHGLGQLVDFCFQPPSF